MIRVVVIGDTHVGGLLGLVPNEFNPKFGKHDPLWSLRKKATNKVIDKIISLGHLDYLVCNGDLVEGKNIKDYGRNVILPDISDQINAAFRLIELIPADNKVFTAGSPYHTVNGGDYEKTIARECGGHLVISEALNIEGFTFTFRHHISSSRSVIGKATPLLKESVVNLINNVKNGKLIQRNILVFSHCHYFMMVQDSLSMVVTAPALVFDSGTLARKNTNISDFGFLEFVIHGKEEVVCRSRMFYLQDSQKKLAAVV